VDVRSIIGNELWVKRDDQSVTSDCPEKGANLLFVYMNEKATGKKRLMDRAFSILLF